MLEGARGRGGLPVVPMRNAGLGGVSVRGRDVALKPVRQADHFWKSRAYKLSLVLPPPPPNLQQPHIRHFQHPFELHQSSPAKTRQPLSVWQE